MTGHGGRLLVIACGALAREINWLRVNHNWRHVEVTCLDAALHNRPESIPDAVDNLIQQHQSHYDQLFVAYGDCGTGGRLDAVLQRRGVERLPGAHCYSFYATEHRLRHSRPMNPVPSTTDFLVRHDRLVVQGLKFDQYPELQDQLFAHYQQVVYLAQTDEPELHGQPQLRPAPGSAPDNRGHRSGGTRLGARPGAETGYRQRGPACNALTYFGATFRPRC